MKRQTLLVNWANSFLSTESWNVVKFSHSGEIEDEIDVDLLKSEKRTNSKFNYAWKKDIKFAVETDWYWGKKISPFSAQCFYPRTIFITCFVYFLELWIEIEFVEEFLCGI